MKMRRLLIHLLPYIPRNPNQLLPPPSTFLYRTILFLPYSLLLCPAYVSSAFACLAFAWSITNALYRYSLFYANTISHILSQRHE